MVVPTSEQAVVPALTRAKEAGISVIIVNNTPKDGTQDLYLSFVGQDQTEMGRLAGAAMLKALKDSGRDGGKVAMITGALQQGIAPRRVNGFRRFINESEKERARFAEQKQLFSEYLPYAIVFGATERWARAFEGLDAEPPDMSWYRSTMCSRKR